MKFAFAHGLKGTDFDSLTSQYSTQGPSLYMLAKILNHPDAAVDAVIDEFCDGFGPAKGAVKEYFQLWESVYPNLSPEEQSSRLAAKRKYGAGIYGPYYLIAGEIYTPQAMTAAGSILEKARHQATGDAMATARVEWLAKGLRQAELLLAAARANERGVNSGDKAEFRAAYKALQDFRSENAEYDKVNFAGLSGSERTWNRGKR